MNAVMVFAQTELLCPKTALLQSNNPTDHSPLLFGHLGVLPRARRTTKLPTLLVTSIGSYQIEIENSSKVFRKLEFDVVRNSLFI